MLRNSNCSSSKPYLASTTSKTRSAILAMSSMASGELGHSRKVIRLVFEVATVIGPMGLDRL